MTKKIIRRLINLYDDIESDRPYSRIKMVAFLVHKNKLISFGVNSEKTSLYQHRARQNAKVNWDLNTPLYDKTHAEIAAIKKIHPSFSDWDEVEILIVSKKKDGVYRKARPCPICERVVKEKGIRKIYYTNAYNGITEEKFL